MKKTWVVIISLLFIVFCMQNAIADSLLFESALNVNGTISSSPAGLSAEGLGSVTVTRSTAGAHFVGLFVDHEFSREVNTYFNEYGDIVGTPTSGQTWEIDEPGWVFGDIYDNFTNSSLDNSNGVPFDAPDDVSMALGWDFSLNAGDVASVVFHIVTQFPTNVPAPSFFLAQYDPDSQESLFFYSTLTIRQGGGGTNPVPEPGTMLLLGTGIAGIVAARRRRK